MVWLWRNVFRPSLGKVAAIFQLKESVGVSAGDGKSFPDLLVNLEQARREWLYANTYFNCVADQDLIDHAIYYLGATEKKYVYLLKQARAKGICADTIFTDRAWNLKTWRKVN